MLLYQEQEDNIERDQQLTIASYKYTACAARRRCTVSHVVGAEVSVTSLLELELAALTQCGGLSMRCHQVTVYQDIKI